MQTVVEMWNISEHFLVKRSLLKDMQAVEVNFKFYLPDDLLSCFFPDLRKSSKYSKIVKVASQPPRRLESHQLVPKNFDQRRECL